MFEVIFGICIGLAFAIFMPNAFNQLRTKVRAWVNVSKCNHGETDNKSTTSKRKWHDE